VLPVGVARSSTAPTGDAAHRSRLAAEDGYAATVLRHGRRRRRDAALPVGARRVFRAGRRPGARRPAQWRPTGCGSGCVLVRAAPGALPSPWAGCVVHSRETAEAMNGRGRGALRLLSTRPRATGGDRSAASVRRPRPLRPGAPGVRNSTWTTRQASSTSPPVTASLRRDALLGRMSSITRFPNRAWPLRSIRAGGRTSLSGNTQVDRARSVGSMRGMSDGPRHSRSGPSGSSRARPPPAWPARAESGDCWSDANACRRWVGRIAQSTAANPSQSSDMREMGVVRTEMVADAHHPPEDVTAALRGSGGFLVERLIDIGNIRLSSAGRSTRRPLKFPGGSHPPVRAREGGTRGRGPQPRDDMTTLVEHRRLRFHGRRRVRCRDGVPSSSWVCRWRTSTVPSFKDGHPARRHTGEQRKHQAKATARDLTRTSKLLSASAGPAAGRPADGSSPRRSTASCSPPRTPRHLVPVPARRLGTRHRLPRRSAARGITSPRPDRRSAATTRRSTGRRRGLLRLGDAGPRVPRSPRARSRARAPRPGRPDPSPASRHLQHDGAEFPEPESTNSA